VDGRLVFLGLVVVLAGFTARDLQPVRPAGAIAAEEAQRHALDAVLVDLDHAQLCYARRRDVYADTISSLQFSGGHYMRIATQHGLDIALLRRDGGKSYEAHVSGAGIDGAIARDGAKLVRLDVGDRRPPVPDSAC
jgi:hypothetical protein